MKRSAPRACMVSFYFSPRYSGSAVQAFNLCRHLRTRGIEALIVSANLTGSPRSECIDGIPVERLSVLDGANTAVPTFAASLALFLVRNRGRFDVIHAHGTLQHGIASIVGRLLGKKTILKIAMADSDVAFHRQGRLAGRVNRFFVRRFDRIVATSVQARAECLAQGLDPRRVVLIPNGVDTQSFRPVASAAEKRALRAALGLPQTPLACFVGVLDRRKNVDGALRVWRRVRAEGVQAHFAIVGPFSGDGRGGVSEYVRTLQALAQEPGVAGSVSFAGEQRAVADYLRCADAFLFTSRREGMPNVVLEAMASGVACVSSSIGGSSDLIRDGETGYLFEVDDEEGQACALRRLLLEPEHAAAIGEAARQAALAQYSLPAVAARYERLYAELLADR